MTALVACGGGGDDDGDVSDIPVTVTDFTLSLSSGQVVAGTPAPASASGTGSFQTRARGNIEILASGSVTLSGIDATGVSIQAGFAGETGSAVLELQQSGSTTWDLPADTELDEADLRRLEQSGFHVLVSSPQGQLRGQILPEGWSVVMFDLSGDDVVPAVATTATGRGGISVQTESATGRFSYHLRVTTSGLADASAAVMARAFAGANGDTVVTLEQSSASSDVWGTGDVNDLNFAPFLTDTGLEQFLSGEYYVVVQSATNVSGEIRGQLVPDGVELHPVTLSADEVVADGPVTSTGSASAVATYRPSSGEIAVNLMTDLPTPLGVSLHQAPFGENGPLLFSLVPDASVAGLWSLAATALSAEQQSALENAELYLTVATSPHPEGELRGQLIIGGNAPVTSMSIGDNGGKLVLNDPAGSTFELSLPANALSGETTITMERSEAPFDLPSTLPPSARTLATVELGPEGLTFAVAPTLTITGTTMEGPGGPRIGFVSNEDGSVIELVPLAGDDALAATAPAPSHRLQITHFSTAGVIELDENDLDLRLVPIPQPSGAEAAARHRLAQITAMASTDPLGLASFQAEIDAIFADWLADLTGRSSGLNSPPVDLSGFWAFTQELDRFEDSSRTYEREGSIRDELAGIDAAVLMRLAGEISSLDNACGGGDTGAFDSLLAWLDAVEALYEGSPPAGVPPAAVNCLVTVELSPEGPLAAIQGTGDIEVMATVLSPGGVEVTTSGLIGFSWRDALGSNSIDGASVALDASSVGLRAAEATFKYFSVDRSIGAVIVPEHRGARAMSVSGSAASCADEDDNGPGGAEFTGQFDTEIVEPLSDTAAGVRLIGTAAFGEVLADSIEIEATYDENNETSVSGFAGGGASFTVTETFEDEIVVTTGSVTFFGGTASGRSFLFPNATGSDSSGCVLTGQVAISE